MDLGTVKKNLKNNKYKTVEEALNDIQLIWGNCKTYNAEGSVNDYTNVIVEIIFYSGFGNKLINWKNILRSL